MKNAEKQTGSITVEAALVLPFVICVILTLGLFTRVYYTYSIIHHALSEAAYEMAGLTYAYYSVGLYDLEQEVSGGLDRKAAQGEARLKEIQDAYNSILEIAEDLKKSPEGFLEGLAPLKEEFDNLKETGKEIKENPMNELKGFASMMVKGLYHRGKDALGNELIKSMMKKHLLVQGMEGKEGADLRLKGLHVVGGWDGLDFSGSKYLNEEGNIDIVLTYKIQLPLPIQFAQNIPIVQRVTLRPWMAGQLPQGKETAKAGTNLPADLLDEVIDPGFDVWQLAVRERGRKIKEILGGNLDPNFPTLDALKDGQAIAIRTHDIRLASNQGKGLYYQLTSEIRKLEAYETTTHQGVTIGPGDYQEKWLYVVVPDVEATEEQIQYLRDAKAYGKERGISIKLIVVK